MPRILNRDEDLRPHISSRASPVQAPRVGRLRLRLSGSSRRGIRPKAVGVHVPRASRGSAGGSVGIVKAKYVSSARAHGLSQYLQKDMPDASERLSRYVGRDDAGPEGHKAELFGARGSISEEDRERFVERSHHDPRLWHVIVSPPAADKLNMELFVNRFMQQVEADTGLTLDYIASIHRDTDHVHSHILVRGRDQGGAEFRLDRDYLSHGMRQRVEQISQRHLDLGLSRAEMRETVVEVARSAPQHARALVGRQAARNEGIGY